MSVLLHNIASTPRAVGQVARGTCRPKESVPACNVTKTHCMTLQCVAVEITLLFLGCPFLHVSVWIYHPTLAIMLKCQSGWCTSPHTTVKFISEEVKRRLFNCDIYQHLKEPESCVFCEQTVPFEDLISIFLIKVRNLLHKIDTYCTQ